MKKFQTQSGLWIVLAALMAIATLLPASLKAQSFYGSIVGTVTDSTGAIVPGAAVTVTDIATNEKHTAQSNAAGEYGFVSLVPATYTVSVQKTSFKRFERQQVTVQVGATVRIDAALQVGDTTETVEVTTEAPLLQTDSGTLGTVVEGKTIDQMPLNGRNTMNLLSLAPGVVPTNNSQGGVALGNQTHTTTSNWGAYSIGGGLTGMNAMYLDGSPLVVLGGGGAGTIGFVPTQDAVQEFNISTNASTSEFGRYSGGVVNMTTKSGTNNWHGTTYEYVRNRIFNANEFFNKASELSKGQKNKPGQWNQNQYGATVEGPVMKNKMFFMASWESFKAALSSLQSRTVPTPDMLAGQIDGQNVAASVNAAALTFQGNAACGATYNSTGNYTTIPKACWDPSATVMLTEYPGQNTPGASNNFQALTPTGNNTDSYVGRLDYNLSDKQRIFVRYDMMNLMDLTQEWMPGGKMPDGTLWHLGGGTTHNRAQNGVVGDTLTLSPTTILDARFSIMRVYNDQVPPMNGMKMSVFGSNWATLANQMSVTNAPSFSISDPSSLTNSGLMNPTGFLNAGQLSYLWNDNDTMVFSLTKIHGPHSLKMGGEIRFMDHESLSESGNALSAGGSFSFSNTNFAKEAYSNFLLGLADSAFQTNVKRVGSYNWYQGYYINDTWQASHKLTVNAGLRWELPGNIKAKKDNMMELMPGTSDTTTVPGTTIIGTEVLVNSTAYSDRGTEPARHDLFAPSVGFAYRLTDVDVIRGGYGFSIAPIDIQGGQFPENDVMNSFNNSWNYTATNIVHPLSNPFPSGLGQPQGRTGFSTVPYLKQNVTAAAPTQLYPYTQQWNLAISHQFKGNLMVEIGYAGSVAHDLPMTYSYNQLASQFWSDPSMYQAVGAAGVTTSVSSSQMAACNPIWTTGTKYGQCARPHSAYLNFNDAIGPYGSTNYQGLPVRLQKRFSSGGLLNASFNWSKALGNTGGGTGSPQNPGGAVQDWNNLRAERSVTAFSISRRLVVSYVYNLPFGKGGKFLSDVSNPVAQRVISGWTVNGITTFQSGFPITIAASEPGGYVNIPVSFGAGSLRPNYLTGCTKTTGGSWKSHVVNNTSALNASCWQAPGTGNTASNAYQVNGAGNWYVTSVGNAPRIDGGVFAPGNNNWDLSVSKKTDIAEGINLEFRIEGFNAFNHVRFGAPGGTLNGGGGNSPTFGAVNGSSSGENTPRLGQLSLRLNF